MLKNTAKNRHLPPIFVAISRRIRQFWIIWDNSESFETKLFFWKKIPLDFAFDTWFDIWKNKLVKNVQFGEKWQKKLAAKIFFGGKWRFSAVVAVTPPFFLNYVKFVQKVNFYLFLPLF